MKLILMNKKTIIQIVVITICFGGAGLVLYNGLFKKSGSNPTVTGIAPAAMVGGQSGQSGQSSESNEAVLPYGSLSKDAFDKVLKRQNFRFGRQNYPKLNPDSDLGVREENLIPPIEKKQTE